MKRLLKNILKTNDENIRKIRKKQLKLTTLGFTLIELLAVIVIIAVIALITIPLIGRVIENAKKGALTASASGIIEAAEIYYSTKMMENPKTKTFTCSSEGCISGEEKLDYKGQISEGRVILYADGKVSICIEDGTNASLKLAEQSEITTEEGSCNYESEDYSIDAMVSKSKYNELQDELNHWKKGIATSITNKGVETSETATLEEMMTNIEAISSGDLEKAKLLDALKYSDLGLTEDSTADEIYTALAEYFPEYLSLLMDGWYVTYGGVGTATHEEYCTTSEVKITQTYGDKSGESGTRAYYNSPYFDISDYSRLVIKGESYKNNTPGTESYAPTIFLIDEATETSTQLFQHTVASGESTNDISIEYDVSGLTGRYRLSLKLFAFGSTNQNTYISLTEATVRP